MHYEFLPTGQTVNKEYYLYVMRHLRKAIRKKRPESGILCNDNVPSHTALISFELIKEIEQETVRTLKAIPTDDLPACFEDWRKRWNKCIGVGGIILGGRCRFERINKDFIL